MRSRNNALRRGGGLTAHLKRPLDFSLSHSAAMSSSLFHRRRKAPSNTHPVLICIVPTACFVAFLLVVSFVSSRTRCNGGRATEGWRYSLKNPLMLIPADEASAVAASKKKRQGSVDPDLAAFYGLSSERLWRMAPDGYLHITYANFHYLDFVLNWVNHMDKAGITSYVIGCMDSRILLELNARSIPTIDMRMEVSKNDLGWGSREFYKSGEEMIRLNLAVLQFGITVIGQDVDTVWFRDPTEFWERYPRADILCSSDHYFSTTKDDGLEDSSKLGTVANTGLYVLRPTALAFTKEWLEAIGRDDLGWEQRTFWEVYLQGYKHIADDPDRLFRVYKGTLMMGLLPTSTFTSGHPYFVQHLPDSMGLKPYFVHATFQYFGVTGKRHRLRDDFLWTVDPPEYYDTPGGFLAWDFHIPKELLADSVPKNLTSSTLDDVHGHFDLMNYQLTQIRNALAVAKVLERTLIFNEIWCGHDRWWNPHTGLLPTVQMKLPFVCPLDYILDLSVMKPEQTAEYDPALEPFIDFRESSFLHNERLPESVTASELRVEICETKRNNCASGKGPAAVSTFGKRPTVYLSANLTDVEIKTSLKNVGSHKLLRFSSMQNTFAGFQNPKDAADFQANIAKWASIWCCVEPEDNKPGHVWLDLFHDVTPHIDRHGRVWNKTHPWIPLRGP